MKLTLKNFQEEIEQIRFKTPLLKKVSVNGSDPVEYDELHLKVRLTGHRNFIIDVYENDDLVASVGSISKFNRFNLKINNNIWTVIPEAERNRVIKLMMHFAMLDPEKREDFTTSEFERKEAKKHQDKRNQEIIDEHNKPVNYDEDEDSEDDDDDEDYYED